MKKIIIPLILTGFYLLNSAEPDSLITPRTVKYHLEGVSIVAEKPSQAIGNIETKSWEPDAIIIEQNIASAIANISGLKLNRGGKSGTELSIRGFEKEDITIMMDGRPLGGGYFDAVDLSGIPASDIKEIQVIKGPVSALYGSNTMGGVINIVSRQPLNDAWLKLNTQFQRNNTNTFRLSSAHRFTGWDYLISLARSHTDGFPLSDDFTPQGLENGGIRDYSARRQYDFQSKMTYNFLDFHKLSFSANFTLMDFREIPVSTHEIYNPTYPNDVFRKYSDWKRYQFNLGGLFQLDWNQKLNMNLYYDGYDDIYQTFRKENYVDKALDSRLLSSNQGLIAKYEIDVTPGTIIAGYRGERQSFKRKDNQSYQDWTSNWQFLQNAFIQLETRIADITVSSGCGFSLFYQNQRDNFIYHIEPSLGFYYEDSNFARYNLAFSNNVNYPALHELFSSSSGNPNLEEESAWKYEFTTSQPFFSGSLNLSLFYNHITDLVDKMQVTPYKDMYMNIEKVQNYGLEAGYKWIYLLEHSIEYRYLAYTENSDRLLSENPQNMLIIDEKITLPASIRFHANASWQDSARSEGHNMPSYWLFNAYLERNFSRFKVKLGLENILDTDYEDKYGYPQAGWNFLFALETIIF